MKYDALRALDLLRQGTADPKAHFREGQEEAIRAIIETHRRLLVVQRTGWGKSFVYFIATKLLREAGAGPALLVSPLLALMRNQIQAAERMGLRALSVNSTNADDWYGVREAIEKDAVDILLISPERFTNAFFVTTILSVIAPRVRLLIVDEAHCISDWGHDFRPHYRMLERLIRRLPREMRVLATTATANRRVMQDLREVLGQDLAVSHGNLVRSSLTLQTIRLNRQAERLAWLADHLPTLPGSGIVYVLTVRDARRVTEWLQSRHIAAQAYYGELANEERVLLEEALQSNRLKVLVATSALGMGFDKPDLAFVIHYQTPGSVVAYYQQVGRAGRALPTAYGVLLSGQEELEVADYFIRSAFPSPEEVSSVLKALEEAPEGLLRNELLGRVNLSWGRLHTALMLMELESPSPIVNDGGRWRRTLNAFSPAFWERVKRITTLRRQELAQMQSYVRLPFGEHMAFLVKALDGTDTVIPPPAMPPLPVTFSTETLRAASDFLRASACIVEPRSQWPIGGLKQYDVRRKIPEALRSEEGRTLCLWGDSYWGNRISEGKYQRGYFDDELLEGCRELYERWQPQPKPVWVTAVPSLRHPQLVPDFARRLAERLGLPFYVVLRQTTMKPEQKTMQNSQLQAANLDGAFEVDDKVPSGPVLLIDDMVDSRWTMTVAAWLLRSHGSGEVFPMALALSSRG